MERNAIQAESFCYQHSSIFETDIESAINCNVSGAQQMKELLEGNREARNAAAAATRRANAKQEATTNTNETVNA
jgi:hypothetical protein